MSDINANIGVNFDTAQALAELKNLQRQLSQFHTSISRTSESAAIAQKNLQTNLLNSVNATGNFIAQMGVIKTSTESFTHALENNKLSMREYFRYAGGASKTFGRLFTNEFNTIGRVAEERVKRLQTQYIKMGRDTTGAMKAMSIMPASLDMSSVSTKLQIAAQKQAIFNQLLKQGSTQLLNFGKNTQWAGRQLMVGFTIPLVAFGSSATKAFQDIETAAIKFKRVYGDLGTSQQETDTMLDQIKSIADGYTKYGVAVKDTIALSADAAAAGFKNADLIAQTTQATKLSVLGQIGQQQALETTISLQSAFGISADKLAGTIDFLNAVENQTVVSLDDITTAIPKVAPVIQQLGGDVKDLAFFMTAMKEGGVNASEGANALKSGLASLINPSTKAKEMLAGVGINISAIVEKDKGNLKKTVIDVANALDTLDPLTRARAIEQMFGKFQFARMSTLFDNINKGGTQSARVLDLMGLSASDLASITDKELGIQGASALTKFRAAIEKLKASLAPVGELFMKIFTPILESIGGLLDKFNNLSDGAKKAIGIIVAVVGGLGPVVLMTFGLLMNAFANGVKLFATLRAGYQRLTGGSVELGQQTQYLTMEQLDAAAAAHSLDQSHAKLIQTFNLEAGAVNSLRSAYSRASVAANAFRLANPGMIMPTAKKYAEGGIISGPGTGTSDSIPAMVSNGESIISAKQTKKYGGLINSIISDNIPGYATSKKAKVETIGTVLGGSFPSRKYSPVAMMAPGNNAAGPGMDLEWLKLNEEARASFAASIKTAMMMEQDIKVTQRNYEKFGTNLTPVLDNIFDIFKGGVTDSTKNISEVGQSQYPLIIKHLESLQLSGKITADEFASMSVAARKLLNPLESDLTQKNLQRIELATSELGDIYVKRAATERSGETYKPQIQRTFEVEKRLRGLPPSENYPGGYQFAHIPESTPTPTYVEPHLRKKAGAGSAVEQMVMDRIRSGETFKEGKVVMKKAGADSMLAYEEGTRTVKLEDPYVKSRDRNSPHRLAAKDGRDDTIAYDTATQKSIARNQRNIAKRSGNSGGGNIPPVIVTGGVGGGNDDNLNSQTKKTTSSLAGLNNKIMGASFGLTTLASMGSMSGGKLGELSNQVMKYSGILFGLMSVTQLMTKQALLNLTVERLRVAQGAIESAKMAAPGVASGVAGAAGKSGILGMLGRVALGLKVFLGPIGIATTVLTGLYLGFKLIKSQQEKSRLAIEGLGDAALLSGNKLKTLGDFFGVKPQTTRMERTGPSLVLNKEKRTQVDELKSSEGFQKDFKNDIQSLKGATDNQAKLIFNSLAIQLKGKGFAKDNIDTILKALQEESGKTNVKLDFAKIDLATEEGQKELQKSAKTLGNSFGKQFGEGYSKSTYDVMNYSTGKIVTVTNEKMSKGLQKNLNLTSKAFAGMMNGLSGQLENGSINAEQFNQSFETISKTITDMPEPQAIVLMNNVIKNLPGPLAKSALGIKNVKDQMLIAKAAALGVATITPAMIEALRAASTSADGGAQRAAFRVKTFIKKEMAEIQAVMDLVNKEAGKITGGGDTGPANPTAAGNMKEMTKAMMDQAKAYRTLRNAGYDAATAATMAGDALIAAGIASSKVKVGSKEWKILIADLKEAQLQADATAARMSLEKQKKDIDIQLKAYEKLVKAGYSAEKAAELVGDVSLSTLIMNTGKAGMTFAELKKLINDTQSGLEKIKNLGDPFGINNIKAQMDVFNKNYEVMMEKFRIQEVRVRQQYQPAVDKAQAAVDEAQAALDKVTADYAAKLDPITDRTNVLNHDLSLIDKQAESVNEKYDAQAAALEQVNKLNQDAIQQGKSRISIADALSQGDIAAAAQAVQDSRAANAASNAQNQTDMLQRARQQELDNIKINGLTRKQIEDELWTLSQKQYDLELERDAALKKANEKLEDTKTKLKEAEKTLADQLKKIEDQKLAWENAKLAIDEAQNGYDAMNISLTAQLALVNQIIAAWKAAGEAKAAAEATTAVVTPTGKTGATTDSAATAKDAASTAAAAEYAAALAKGDTTGASLAAAKVAPSALAAGESGAIGAASIAAQLKAAVDASTAAAAVAKNANTLANFKAKENAENAAAAAAAVAAANAKGRVGRMKGGIIPQYFADGGGPKGTDTVPAWLTPGEYVVNAKASKVFGPLLEAINTGSFPSFQIDRNFSTPSYSTGNNSNKITNTIMPINNTGIQSDNSNTVYNYSLSFNINGDKVNSSEIANTVMNKIRQLQDQQLKGQVRL